jgi:predicted ATPase
VHEPLLERERELKGLRRALADARQGRGRVVLVEGVAGLGKTSLLRAALEAAREDGFTCLRARASELERAFAYERWTATPMLPLFTPGRGAVAARVQAAEAPA